MKRNFGRFIFISFPHQNSEAFKFRRKKMSGQSWVKKIDFQVENQFNHF
jgi:hypothetical protein